MRLAESYYRFLSAETDRAHRVRAVVLLAYAFSLPFNMIYSSVLFGGLCVLTLLSLNRERLRSVPRQIWIFQLVYLLSLSGYFYSYDRVAAGFLLERQLSILLFPVILPLALTPGRELARLVVHTLFVSCTLAVMFLLARHFYRVLYTLGLSPEFLFSGAFLNHGFSLPLGIHAGYLSLYVSLSLFYIIHRVESNRRWRVAGMLALLVLCAGMLFLASRNSIIATVLVLLLVYPFFARRPVRYLIVSVTGIVVVLTLILSVEYLRERFSIFLLEDIGQLDPEVAGAGRLIEPRYERWRCAWQMIWQSPLFGYGTGDEIPVLRYCYIRSGLYLSYLQDYNAHNTFLSVVLKHGIFGLILFVGSLAWFVRLAIRSRNFLHVAFMVVMIIGFYTENLLDANKGIVFFALFNTLFGYAALRQPAEERGS